MTFLAGSSMQPEPKHFVTIYTQGSGYKPEPAEGIMDKET